MTCVYQYRLIKLLDESNCIRQYLVYLGYLVYLLSAEDTKHYLVWTRHLIKYTPLSLYTLDLCTYRYQTKCKYNQEIRSRISGHRHLAAYIHLLLLPSNVFFFRYDPAFAERKLGSALWCTGRSRLCFNAS